MRKYKEVIAVAIVQLVVALTMCSWAVVQDSDDSDIDVQQVRMAESVFSPPDQTLHYQVAAMSNDANDFLFCVPQDLRTNTTMFVLTNLCDTNVVVYINTFKSDGQFLFTWKLTIGQGTTWRLCTKEYISRCPGEDPPTHLDQGFGCEAAAAILEIPPCVITDGYVVWHGVNNKYDPNDTISTLPLRFTKL